MLKDSAAIQRYALQAFLVTGVVQCYVNGAWCEMAVRETVRAQGRTEARAGALAHVEAAARRVDAGAIVRWHTGELIQEAQPWTN